MKANIYYFSHPEWAEEYLTYCHRSNTFISRWKATLGCSWYSSIMVDISCGLSNLKASLGGSPQTLISVDVAPVSLKLAKKLEYTTVLADATHLPFRSAFADIVALNAMLHHCENMENILKKQLAS